MSSTNTAFGTEGTVEAQRQIERFVLTNQRVTLAVLTSADGFEIAAHSPQQNATQRIAAMASSLQALSEALARESGVANSRNLIIEAEAGLILVLGLALATPRLSLTVVAAGDGVLGQLLWASRQCCSALERSLKPAKN
jgi:predicted regulator of Ras-like GTPase activity (Roadblock/LC7/MglB family)